MRGKKKKREREGDHPLIHRLNKRVRSNSFLFFFIYLFCNGHVHVRFVLCVFNAIFILDLLNLSIVWSAHPLSFGRSVTLHQIPPLGKILNCLNFTIIPNSIRVKFRVLKT